MPPRKHELYHWDRIWEADIETTFSEREIAGERALEAAFGDVRMYFGLGPPLATDSSQNRSLRILEAIAPRIRGLRWGRQVHGCEVAAISREHDPDLTGVVCVGECDALMTTEEGVGLMVWTADCVPVLLAGPRVVAAIHSGWRGTAPISSAPWSGGFRRITAWPPTGSVLFWVLPSPGRGTRSETRSSGPSKKSPLTTMTGTGGTTSISGCSSPPGSAGWA